MQNNYTPKKNNIIKYPQGSSLEEPEDNLSSMHRTIALGLLLEVLEQQKAAHSDLYVMCPDGKKISFEDSVQCLHALMEQRTPDTNTDKNLWYRFWSGELTSGQSF